MCGHCPAGLQDAIGHRVTALPAPGSFWDSLSFSGILESFDAFVFRIFSLPPSLPSILSSFLQEVEPRVPRGQAVALSHTLSPIHPMCELPHCCNRTLDTLCRRAIIWLTEGSL